MFQNNVIFVSRSGHIHYVFALYMDSMIVVKHSGLHQGLENGNEYRISIFITYCTFRQPLKNKKIVFFFIYFIVIFEKKPFFSKSYITSSSQFVVLEFSERIFDVLQKFDCLFFAKKKSEAKLIPLDYSTPYFQLG